MFRLTLVAFAFVSVFSNLALAANSARVTAQGRLLLGMLSTNPKILNDYLSTQNIDQVKKVNRIGLELGSRLATHFYLGVRMMKNYESLAGLNSADSASLQQTNAALIARVPFTKSEAVYADVFLGAGGVATSYSQKGTTAGELNSSRGVYSLAGFSASVGFKMVQFFTEIGYEYSNPSAFVRTGAITTPNDINLSGPFINVGLMIDGIIL